MAPTETGIIDSLLKVARKRVQTHGTPGNGSSTAAEAANKPARRREAEASDFAAVVALKTRYGLSPDSPENWDRLWLVNPALSQAKQPLSMGWVQEADGEIVGYMGSIPLLYQYGDQTMVAAATTCYVAEPGYRAGSLGLIGSFFRQQGCDLFLDTTAGVPAGKIMRGFKAEPMPQKDCDTVFFWVLNSQAFLRAAMEKLQVARGLGKFASWLGSPVLKADILFRGRWPKRTAERFSCRVLRIEEIDGDFQDLWMRKVQERPRLMACRTPEILRWHFLTPNSRRRNHVLACFHERRLAGYLILQTGLAGPHGLRKAIVADLIAIGGHPGVIAELFAGAYELAKKEGSDLLEAEGFPEEVRRVFQTWSPFNRRFPGWPFYYKTDRTPLRELLTHEESWYACPFDGDTTLSA
ncbi:MAG: hypothetical protein WB997_08890 [Candidatus Acidiferrales bacterium]